MTQDNPCRKLRLRLCLYCLACCLCATLNARQAEPTAPQHNPRTAQPVPQPAAHPVAPAPKPAPQAESPVPQPDDTITGKTHAIPEVGIKARRRPSRTTSATPVQTFTRRELDALGLHDVASAARRFAGVAVKDYGGLGGLKTVSIRNLGAAHTAVSYDGTPVSNCQAGQIDIGRFSTDNVSTLSLTVGQGDDPLQPARMYASAGILHINTLRPDFTPGRRHHFSAQARTGSFGLLSTNARWEQQAGARSALTLDASLLRSDGAYPFRLENGKYTAIEKRHNSDILSYQGEANLFHLFADSSRWDTKAYYYRSRRGLPGGVILYNPESHERLTDENFFLQTRWSKTFSPLLALQLQGKYNYSYNRYRDEGPEYQSGIAVDRHTQHEYYLSAALAYTPLRHLTLSLAQDGAINTLDNTMPYCPFPTRYTSLSALSAKYALTHLTLQATLLATYITEHVKTGTPPAPLHRLSPSLSLSYRPWRERLFFLRAMYKDCFRVPTFNDLYYYRSGNKNLRPEKAREYNLGITYGGSPLPFIDYLSVTLDAYYNRVTDKIVAFPSTYVWSMQNYGKVRILGLDATLAAECPVTRHATLHLSCGYTWQDAIDLTNPDAKNYKDQLPYTPRHSGSLSATVKTPWLDAGYTLMAVGKRYYLAQNIPVNEIDGYREHTLSLSREFRLGTCQLRLQADIINLTNEQYDVIKYYPMAGRSWKLTAGVRF